MGSRFWFLLQQYHGDLHSSFLRVILSSILASSVTANGLRERQSPFSTTWLYLSPNLGSVSQSVQSLSHVWLFAPHELQHARPPCPSQTPGVYSNSCPSSWWCHPAISSSVVPFSSCPQSLPASGSFPMSQLFAWDGQSIGVSASANFG